MNSVTASDLRDDGDEVLDRLARGEVLTVTRDGSAVAELRPRARPAISAAELIARRRNLPIVDPSPLRLDLDEVLGGSL